MTRIGGSPEPSMSGKSLYRIEVRGTIPAGWLDRLGDLAIEAPPDSESSGTTVLRGSVRDQAALTGILATLYELHLPVVSVEWVPASSERPTTTENPS